MGTKIRKNKENLLFDEHNRIIIINNNLIACFRVT